MQTFLPYSNFSDSAKCLDMRRLNKQRLEALQLLKGQWKHHPASKMWRGYEIRLAKYGLAICEEWIARGYVDNLKPKFIEYLENNLRPDEAPPWLGGVIHANHRARLLAKKFDYYQQFGWLEEPTEINYWPVK